MEKYLIKKNRLKDAKRAKTCDAKKSPLKYGRELVAVGIMVLEALKQTFVRIYTSQNALVPLPGFLGSISLFLFWLVLEVHCQHRKKPWLKVLKEAVLLGSFCVYIINILMLYFEDYSKVKNEISEQYSLIFGMLLVLIMLQKLLEMTIFSKLALVTGFFAYILAQNMKNPDTDFFASGFNILTPALYILALIFIDFKNDPQQGKITNLDGPSDFHFSSLLKMVDQSVFVCDKLGNFKLLNQMCLSNIDYQNDETQFINRVNELKLISEEILPDHEQGLPQEVNFTQKDSNNYLPRKKTGQKVAIQIGVDPMANLASLLKSTLVRMCNKEIILPKYIKYYGEIENNESVKIPLQIKLIILPNHKAPLIFTIQDDQAKEQLQSKKLCAQLQNSIVNHFCSELYRIVELTKSTLLQSLENPLKLPTIQNLGLLSRLIEDTIELFHENKYQPKFQYYRCNLKEILENVISLFQAYAKSKNVKLTSQCQEADCTVSTDQERLLQLLIQLVYNAIKFTQGNSVHLSLQGYNNTFKIMVSDPGSIIPQQEIGSIQNDLKTHKVHFGDIFLGNKYKKKNLMLSHFTALGLGRKPLSGLHIKSSAESGTSIWFFVENRKISLLTSDNMQKMKASVSTQSSSNHKSLRPSIFKMTYEYNNTQDSTSSLSEISESIQVGSVNNYPAFENVFPDNNYISPRPKSESFSASLKQFKKYKGTSSLLPSYIIEEVPDSPSKQGEYILFVSKDISETDRILKFSAINGYIGVRIPFWENLGIEIQHKQKKIIMILIDFEYIPTNPEPLEQVIQKKTQECEISPLIVGITHSLSFGDIDHRPCANFIHKFVSKPFDNRKFLSLIKSVYKSNNS